MMDKVLLTSGGLSVGIVRLRTQSHGVCLLMEKVHVSKDISYLHLSVKNVWAFLVFLMHSTCHITLPA
jgi:hypothetical protein